jgi:hypothetical protein
MPDISIDIPNLPAVIGRLRAIEGGSRFALRTAIQKALRGATTEMTREARGPHGFNIGLAYLRAAIGRPRMSGPTSGFLRVSSSRTPYYLFPFKDRRGSGGGVEIAERKDSPEVVFRHAFARASRAQIFQMTNPKVQGRLTGLAGPSAPAMIGSRKVFPTIRERLQRDLETELNRLTALILAGKVEPK